MASIKKRRDKYNVVYYYTNDAGERKQKWEPYDTEAEAKQRKAEIEYKQKVVFHSLRHSSATYKLKLNHGDLKATQGDTGHAQAQMLTEIYAHILDEDRKVNAQKFEAAFYSNPDLRGVRAPETPAPAAFDIASLVEQLQKSPELCEMLSKVLAGQAAV